MSTIREISQRHTFEKINFEKQKVLAVTLLASFARKTNIIPAIQIQIIRAIISDTPPISADCSNRLCRTDTPQSLPQIQQKNMPPTAVTYSMPSNLSEPTQFPMETLQSIHTEDHNYVSSITGSDASISQVSLLTAYITKPNSNKKERYKEIPTLGKFVNKFENKREAKRAIDTLFLCPKNGRWEPHTSNSKRTGIFKFVCSKCEGVVIRINTHTRSGIPVGGQGRATLEIKSGDSKSHVYISCCKLVEGIPGSGYNNNDSIDKYNNPVYANQADDNRSSQQRQHSQLSTTEDDSTHCNIKKKHRSNQLRYHNRHQWWIINQTTKTLEIRIVLSSIALQAQILPESDETELERLGKSIQGLAKIKKISRER
jgi:hypothetical protein